MGVVIDFVTRLPVEIWFQENPKASDSTLETDILNLVSAKTLLLLDRGFYHFSFWLKLIEKEIHFITRLKKGAAMKVEKIFTDSYSIRDRLIRLGSGTEATPYVTVRLIEVRSSKIWHSYITSVLEPTVLPPYVVADLYRKRWRIEEAFNLVKRLLGLSYLWTGSLNGIKLQIWATWLFYAVLMDLGDAVADELALPVDPAQSRWREPKKIILKNIELFLISRLNLFNLSRIITNLRKTQEGKSEKRISSRTIFANYLVFDSRFLLPSWGSQIKEPLIFESSSPDSFVWRSPRFLVLG